MKTINKIDTRLQRTTYGWTAFFMGLVFVVVGGYFALSGFGFLPLPGKANAPLWVIGAVGVAFALGGGVLFGHSLRGLLARHRRKQLGARFQRRPWMQDYPWDPAGIEDKPGARWLNSLVGFLLVGALMVPFNWWAFLSREGPLPVQLITGLFDLILILLLGSLLYRLFQFAKYGYSRISFAWFPFAPGESLKVWFHPNRFDRLEATLRFVEEWFESRGSGENRHVSHKVVEHYSETRQFEPPAGAGTVEMEFELPQRREWVTRLTADPRIRYWELLISSKQPGIDFRTTFPLPVYDRPRSQVTALPAPRPRGASRRLGPYAFELGLPLLLAALLGLAWLLAPAAVEQAGRSGLSLWSRAHLTWELRPLPNIDSSAMDLETGPDGALWLLTKYSVMRFHGSRGEKLLDSARYRAEFGHKMNSLSALKVTGEDEAWAGSWYGELFHYKNGHWSELSSRDEPLGRRIHALAIHQGSLYLGGRDGLWQWREGSGLTRVEGVPEGEIEALAMDGEERLLAGVGPELWRLGPRGWDLLWQASRKERAVTALLPLPDGRLLAGTRNGLVILNGDGTVQDRELPGLRITGLASGSGRLWAGSWKDGIRVRSNREWTALNSSAGLPDNNVSDLALTADGQLWIALYGEGVSHMATEQINK